MLKLQEPVPLFKNGDKAFYKFKEVTILSVQTYCCSCDRFLEEAKYSVLSENKSVNHRVKESELLLPSEMKEE
jgi:hypothetical protein